VDSARANLNAARQKVAEIEGQLAGAQRALDAASGQRGNDEQRVAAARADRDRAAQELAMIHQAADPVIARYNAAVAALDAVRKPAVAGFEMSEPFMRAQAVAETAQRDVKLVEQTALD